MEHYNTIPVLDEPDFKQKKLLQVPILQKYNEFDKNKHFNMKNCASYLIYGLYQHCVDKSFLTKLEWMKTCHDRFCPFCNWRRAKRLTSQAYEMLQKIQSDKDVRYLFLTLTVKNPLLCDLKITIKKMNKAFEKMSRSKRYKNSILGHCKVLEFHPQKNNPKYFHPHFHIVLCVNSNYFDKNKDFYIKQDEWQEIWSKALLSSGLDASQSVNIKIINSKDGDDPISKVVAETFKYPLKSMELNSLSWQEFQILTKQVFGLRIVSFSGIFRIYRNLLQQKDIDDTDIDDKSLIDSEEWERIKELIYRWQNGKYGQDYYYIEKTETCEIIEYEFDENDFIKSLPRL